MLTPMPPATLSLRFAQASAILAILVGSMALAGHLFDLSVLKVILRGWPPMKPNTALCFILNGLALALSVMPFEFKQSARTDYTTLRMRISMALALVPLLLCLLTLGQYLAGINFGIDTLFVDNQSDPANPATPFRPAPETALCHSMLSVALVLYNRQQHSRRTVFASTFLGLMIISLATASLSTYFTPVLGIFGWLGLNVMAGDSAVLFILLGLAVFLLACRQKIFSWEIGPLATAGFIFGQLLLIVIFLTTIRTQYQVSSINEQLARSEMLYAKSADIFSNIAQQQSLILGFLLTDDMNLLNAGLINADNVRIKLSEFDRHRTLSPEESWFYLPTINRAREILELSAETLAAGRSGTSPQKLQALIQQGNTLTNRLKLGLDQSENEHEHFVAELRRRSDYVRKTAFLVISFGMLANLLVFSLVLLHINRLVTERHRAKQELVESEQQYRTLADSGQALIWTAGTDMLCNYFNKVWLDFTGRTMMQELGNGWAEGVHPDDFQSCLDTYVQAFEKRERFSMDYRLRRNDGEYRWIQDDGAPRYDAAGRFIGYIGYCLDITERRLATEALKESELRFRKLLNEVSSIAVQGYAADLTTIYWNQASEILYGYSASEALGQKLTTLIIPPEMVEDVEHAVADMLESGQPLPAGELSLMRKDGSRVEVISSHAVVKVPGKAPELFCIDIDISPRKQIEAELKKYRDHLEELVGQRTAELAAATEAAESANRAKSTFLANMSHEIRTPMNAIIGLTHLLRKELADPNAGDKLAKINEAAQHLLGILNNILDISRIESGHLSIEESEFAPARIVDSTLAMLGDRAAAKGLRLSGTVAPSVPSGLLGDSLRLSQILLNLVGNAVKFSERGEIRVSIAVVEEDAHSVLLRIEVQDQGIGLSAEQQARIFHAFVQADGSTTRKYGGSGLGLVISRHLAQLMGGEIGVESRLGEGSTFWASARLRKIPDTSDQSASIKDKVLLENVIKARFAGRRVLLAEDDPIGREVALELLSLTGLAVDAVDNGKEAVDKVSAGDYALVLMDMQMPVMGGLEATRAIRQLPGKEIRPFVLAMTANAFKEDRQACLDAGMNDHIRKPVDPDALFATLLHWLEIAG